MPPSPPDSAPLIPARMLNEFVYCPRLFHLEWVQGEFQDNHFTVEGKTVHRRVDREDPGALPAVQDERPFVSRAVIISALSLGLTGTIDLVEGEGGVVSPVDYKRGRPAPTPERAWAPERVQLCAYGLMLREEGYRCDEGVLYFAATKTRVPVVFDEALVAETKEAVTQAQALVASGAIPPPPDRSPKCGGCSLNAICLPDEVNLLRGEEGRVRKLVPARDDARTFYVQGHGLRVGLSREVLEARDPEGKTVGTARLAETSHVVLMGNIQISAQALHELFDRGVSVCWATFGGWFCGITDGLGSKNVEIRRRQYKLADDAERSLGLAKRLTRCKVANCRTMLRRNGEVEDRPLRELADALDQVESATSPEALLGIEGNAARVYFGSFATMVRPPAAANGEWRFDFTTRNRRPPTDPVNALLSFAYAVLTKELTLAARCAGLDPFLGFYHRPKHGKPALALDLMEEFRPLIADSAVLTAVNTGAVTAQDFRFHQLGVALSPEGRKRFLKVLERRLSEEVTHPVFEYRISYRRVLEVQCRLLVKMLLGEIPDYPEFRTR